MSERDKPMAGWQADLFVDDLTREGIVVTEQDLLDGAALRRLREALPDERMHVVAMGPLRGRHFETGEPVSPYSVRIGDGAAVVLEASGATIAEAADKCREAL